MRIIDLLSEDRILLGASAQTKEQAIDQMVELQVVHVSDGDRTVEELSGPSVTQTHFTVS